MIITDPAPTLATNAEANAGQSLAALRVGTITAIGVRIVIINIMEQIAERAVTRKDFVPNRRDKMISPCLRIISSHRNTIAPPFPSRCWNRISITIIASWKGGALDFSREEDVVYVI
jgi:hypothetical protein